MPDTVVLLGIRDGDLSRRLEHLGWCAEIAHDVSELRLILARTSVLAVYFDPRSMNMPWKRALGHVMRVAPNAHPIVCLRFSDRTPIGEITAQGGFYVLHLPFAPHEVQQSLGFLHAAVARKRSSLHLTPQKTAAKAG